MNIISREGGTASVLMVPDEIKPLRGAYLPELFEAIGDRYHLTTIPTLEEARKSGARFKGGKFNAVDAESLDITELALFSDGFSATTFDTDDSEIVLADFREWLKEAFGYRDPVTPPIRRFTSELVVDFTKDIANKFGAFKSWCKLLEAELLQTNGIEHVFAFNGIHFVSTPSLGSTAPELLIERRVNSPTRLRYYTKAGFPTASHVKLLEAFEQLVS